MPLCQTSVLKVYQAVIEDVIANVRDAFLDEGVDEQVLQEMKSIWRNKLMASKAVELNPDPPELIPPQIVANNPKPTKAAAAKAKKAAALAAAQQNSTPSTGTTVATTAGANSITSNTSTTSNYGNANGIKQETTQSQHLTNPPPLLPTNATSAKILQQQKANIVNANNVGGAGAIGAAATTSNAQSGQPQSSTIPIVASLDPNRIMPVNITLPAQAGSGSTESRVLTIHVPASALQENHLTQILTAHLISSIMSLPTTLASSVLQQHVNAQLHNTTQKNNMGTARQLDGTVDTSDEDESDESDENMDNDDDEDLDKDDDIDDENDGGAEEEPLNSEDDVTDEDASDLFDTENVIVCQYDKITRSRNKWKFYLKDGIMNIGGKDYVFQKSNGDAEW